MKKRNLFLITFILIASFSCKKNEVSTETTIKGQVLDIETGSPIDSVEMTVYSWSGSIFSSNIAKATDFIAKTDAEGNYEIIFTQNNDRNYNIGPKKIGYEYDIEDIHSQTKTIEIGKSNQINFEMTNFKNISISGRIVNKKSGVPILNAEVSSYFGTESTFINSVFTNSNGLYLIEFKPDYYSSWVRIKIAKEGYKIATEEQQYSTGHLDVSVKPGNSEVIDVRMEED